ncbi:MAG: hypothetical protein KBT31_03720, partial [Firmicutes bacterium]|nr:hypothetical protein [Candidatus Colimorpha enterica]
WYVDLDYQGLDLAIACRGQAYDDYVIGRENSGDIVWDSIFDTNERINGAINVNREFIFGSSNSADFIAQAINESRNDGIYDMIMCDQFHGTAYAADGAYLNVLGLDTEKNFIDITQPYWYGDYMKNVTMGTKTLYFLGGDISPTILGWAACSFMNLNLYEDLFNDIDAFLDEVEAGNWDIDMLREKDTAAYLDLNQNDKVDLDDRLGSATSKGQSAVFAAISAGMTFSQRNSEGLYDLTIDTEENNRIFEKVYDMYVETLGFFRYDFSATPNGNIDTFSAGRMLFMNEYFLYAFKETLREMEDDYVIIPGPKCDENQEKYLSAMQDSFFLYTIPTAVATDKLEAISAYLQVGCELFSENVITAMYENALKVKHVSDKVDMEKAGRIIDLVRAGITSDFAVVYTKSMNGMANMVGQLVDAGRREWHVAVGMQKKMYETFLEDLLLNFDVS